MKKILYIVLGVVVVAAVAGGAWFFMKKGTGESTAETAASTTTTIIDNAAKASDAVTAGAPSAIGKTNPFKANVNPVGGYQNPFGK